MRVAVDARPAVFPHKTGIGYYVWHLLRWLPRVAPSDTIVAWHLNARGLLGGPRSLLRGLAAPNLIERWTPIPATWFERLSERLDGPRLEWLMRFDVLFAPNFVPPPTRARRLVITVHDLAFKRFPETAPHGTMAWLRRVDLALERASRIIVPSEATKADLCGLYPVEPDRVAIVAHGVDRVLFRPAPPGEVDRIRRRFGIEGPYLLSLGGIEPRKNLPGLIDSFGRLDDRSGARLVVAGAAVEWNPEGRDALSAALAGLPPNARQRVMLTGYVSEQDKVALLSGARALVYPSLYEGFGMPVLEAMACGTPVLTSNVSALPEVAGGAALLVDPRDVDAMTEGMARLLSEGALRERLRMAGETRAAGFSWEESARRTAEVLREA